MVTPRWLTILERGLFADIAVIGAVGSGKTSGCLYSYAERILGYGAQNPAKRIGGLVLEVKGDFCHAARRMLAGHGHGPTTMSRSASTVGDATTLTTTLTPSRPTVSRSS